MSRPFVSYCLLAIFVLGFWGGKTLGSPNEGVDLVYEIVSVKAALFQGPDTDRQYYIIIQRIDGTEHKVYMAKIFWDNFIENQYRIIHIPFPKKYE